MTRFRVIVELRVTDLEAAELNARLLGVDTVPAMAGGGTYDADAETAGEAAAEVLDRLARQVEA